MKQTLNLSFTITVDPAPLHVISGDPPSGKVGQSYVHQIVVSGGRPPYTFTATVLPPGLSITSDGVIGGVPISYGSYDCQVVVTDSDGNA